MKKVMLTLAVLFLMALAGTALADYSPFGLVQVWATSTAYSNSDDATFDASQTMFGVKRGRFGWKYKADKFSGKIQMDGAGGTFALLDAYLNHQCNDMFSVRIGRFIGPGAQGGGLTGAPTLDLVERNIVSRAWGKYTGKGDYRLIGLMATVKPNDMFRGEIAFHNGAGTKPGVMASTNTSYGAGSLIDNGFLPAIDLGVHAIPMDGVKLGLTYGLPHEQLQNTGSMTGYLYYNGAGFYGKVDYTMLMNNPIWDDDDADYTSAGFAITGGYSINDNIELVARFEQFDMDSDYAIGDDLPDNWTAVIDAVPADSAYVVNPGTGVIEWVEITAAIEEGVEDTAYAHDYAYRSNFGFGLNYYFDPSAKYDQVFKLAFTFRMDETADGVDIDNPYVIQAMWQVYVH
jgi:hypothetical protein